MAVKSSDLKLLGGWFSPVATRVKIALNIKGLEYENIEEDLESKSDLLLRSNPVYKKIPVLIHGGKPICESSIIVQYIDEVWSNNGPSILPQHTYDRAVARFWASCIDDKLFACMRNILSGGEDEEEKKPHFEQLEEEVFVKLEEAFNKCSDGKLFFGGNNVGFLDIIFGSLLPFIRVIEEINEKKILVDEKFPKLANWAVHFAANSAVTGTLPEIDKLVLYTKPLAQKWAAAKAAAK
ncbi:glutathione s-transferase [Stylosanthes scabra]|uniref:glutathione transferase n=1 Tax=Stylosanthes scabra TaxID=79078 RepID=A0ABU6SS73_9FABA|nr:glutathione s-transferase [Stylosanthes scabra]